jgi:hypothetical protein
LKNLTQPENVPEGFRDDVFLRFFKAAEIAKLQPKVSVFWFLVSGRITEH